MKHRLRPALTAAVGLTLLAGCGTAVPNVDPMLAGPDAVAVRPVMVGERGPLTASESKAILAKLQHERKDTDILQRHLAFEASFTDTPLTVGNKVTLLRDGNATFAAMFQAIRQARNHVNLEYFIIEDIESDGQHIGDLLIAKQNAGVQVNVIYDSFGSLATPTAFFDRLRQAGVKVVDFNPINPLAAVGGGQPNARDHRKILIVDGTTAIVGGVNMSTVYTSNPLGTGATKGAKNYDRWRDTDLEIEGPAVAELQRLFIATWNEQKGPPLRQEDYFPPMNARDGQVVRIVGSNPAKPVPLHYVTLLSAIRNADKRVWMTYGYFVPPEQARQDLQNAARRGVDVRLLLPSKSDSIDALNAGRSHYADLLEAGVKIYELQGAMLHSKTAVIDGVWSSVGSSNFDGRSVVLNKEVDAVVLGRETARQLEAMFENDLKNAKQIDPAVWAQRPMAERMQEVVSRMWGDWL